MINLNINIDMLLIVALIIIFIITVSYLGKYNICDHGLCKIYDTINIFTFDILLYFLIIISIVLILFYFIT